MTRTVNRPARIGHNQGPPLDPVSSWQRHCWRAARRRLIRPLPLEVVRRRVARAAKLGLAYRRDELLVLGGGEIEAFLFAADTLVVRAPYACPAQRLDPAAVQKLAAVTGCRRLVLAGAEGHIQGWSGGRAGLEATNRVPSPPLLDVPPAQADRDAVASGLSERALPATLVVLVGDGSLGRPWSPGSGWPASYQARSISASDGRCARRTQPARAGTAWAPRSMDALQGGSGLLRSARLHRGEECIDR